MAVDIGFGLDTSVLEGEEQDLDDTFGEINGPEVLGQDVYKALSTPSAPVVFVDGQGPFPLLFWEDPPVSWDLRDMLNDSVAPADIASTEARTEAIYAADLRFTRFSAHATYDGRTIAMVTDGLASGQPLQVKLTADSNQITVEAAP